MGCFDICSRLAGVLNNTNTSRDLLARICRLEIATHFPNRLQTNGINFRYGFSWLTSKGWYSIFRCVVEVIHVIRSSLSESLAGGPPFLAGINIPWGAPSFAVFAKDGYHGRVRFGGLRIM